MAPVPAAARSTSCRGPATAQGGPGDAGTLFEHSGPPDFGTLSAIYSFTRRDAITPTTRLVLDTAGNLFGTTTAGLFYDGSVFELSGPLHRTVTVLTRFTTGRDGGFVLGGLAADRAGNLYETTSAGGAGGAGTVFERTGAGFVTSPSQARASPCSADFG